MEPQIMDKTEKVFKDQPSQEISKPDSFTREFSVTFNDQKNPMGLLFQNIQNGTQETKEKISFQISFSKPS